jgi:hypothetical protein
MGFLLCQEKSKKSKKEKINIFKSLPSNNRALRKNPKKMIYRKLKRKDRN